MVHNPYFCPQFRSAPYDRGDALAQDWHEKMTALEALTKAPPDALGYLDDADADVTAWGPEDGIRWTRAYLVVRLRFFTQSAIDGILTAVSCSPRAILYRDLRILPGPQTLPLLSSRGVGAWFRTSVHPFLEALCGDPSVCTRAATLVSVLLVDATGRTWAKAYLQVRKCDKPGGRAGLMYGGDQVLHGLFGNVFLMLSHFLRMKAGWDSAPQATMPRQVHVDTIDALLDSAHGAQYLEACCAQFVCRGFCRSRVQIVAGVFRIRRVHRWYGTRGDAEGIQKCHMTRIMRDNRMVCYLSLLIEMHSVWSLWISVSLFQRSRGGKSCTKSWRWW